MLRIKDIFISTIGPIEALELSFNAHFNIICGQNGVGKSTILDCLAQSFSHDETSLKRKANDSTGQWNIHIVNNGHIEQKFINLRAFHPNEGKFDNTLGFHEYSKQVIVFKAQRDIQYRYLHSQIPNDNWQDKVDSFETILGVWNEGLKDWFIKRYEKIETLDINQLSNHILATLCFSIFNPDINLSRIKVDPSEILLETPWGKIYLEYLSSGYKSSLALLLGLIKRIEEIEPDSGIYVHDFDGVVIIDELDLHLHPEWQATIYQALKAILPKAQIFTSTHSPHILQVADPNEIIPLTFDEKKQIKINPILNQEYGCQGWTIEEILKDVMGLRETRTETYSKAINDFNLALEEENFDLAQKQFVLLDKMLHPENILRKLLKIQLAGLAEHD